MVVTVGDMAQSRSSSRKYRPLFLTGVQRLITMNNPVLVPNTEGHKCELGLLAIPLHSHSAILANIPWRNIFQLWNDGSLMAYRLVNMTVLVTPLRSMEITYSASSFFTEGSEPISLFSPSYPPRIYCSPIKI